MNTVGIGSKAHHRCQRPEDDPLGACASKSRFWGNPYVKYLGLVPDLSSLTLGPRLEKSPLKVSSMSKTVAYAAVEVAGGDGTLC